MTAARLSAPGAGLRLVPACVAAVALATVLLAAAEPRGSALVAALLFAHVVAGAFSLVIGPVLLGASLASGSALRPPLARAHRALGRLYAEATLVAAATALFLALAADRPAAARAGLAAGAAVWLLSTLIAVRQARRRALASHRLWAGRSVALSLNLLVHMPLTAMLAAAAQAGWLTPDAGVALADWGSWLLNLLFVETLLRWGVAPTRPAGRSGA